MTASRSCARTACGDDVWALHYRDLLQKSLLFLVSCQWHIAYAPAGLGTSSAMTTWHRGCAEVTNCHRGPVHLPAIPTTCRPPKWYVDCFWIAVIARLGAEMMGTVKLGRAAATRSNTYQQTTTRYMPVWFEAAVLWGTIASYSATNLGCATRRSITVDPLYRTTTICAWIPSQSADPGYVVRQAQMAARNAASHDCAKVPLLGVAWATICR
jgi:hypothetical protein